MTKNIIRFIGLIQIILGIGYGLFMAQFLEAMGHSIPLPDINYQFGMLAARFISYGAILIYIAPNFGQNLLWLRTMAIIQAIDFTFGLSLTLMGIIGLKQSGFPMFNAIWIGLFCALVGRKITLLNK